jgi:hypothetical protein
MEAQRFDNYHRFEQQTTGDTQRPKLAPSPRHSSPRHTNHVANNLSGGRYDFCLPVGKSPRDCEGAGAAGSSARGQAVSQRSQKLVEGVDLGVQYDWVSSLRYDPLE